MYCQGMVDSVRSNVLFLAACLLSLFGFLLNTGLPSIALQLNASSRFGAEGLHHSTAVTTAKSIGKSIDIGDIDTFFKKYRYRYRRYFLCASIGIGIAILLQSIVNNPSDMFVDYRYSCYSVLRNQNDWSRAVQYYVM